MALSRAIGPLFMLALIALPIWLQIYGHSPLWLIPFAFLFNIFWLPLDLRAAFHDQAREWHGAKAGYVTVVKPLFMALWVSGAIYGATFAVRRWIF